MDLVLFDLDNTLLAGDSDYEWAQFLVDRGVLDRATYEAANDRFYEQYKAGALDIYEFLDFQLAPLARHPRAQLDAWLAEFMDAKIRPMIGRPARDLVAGHLAAGSLCAIVTATNSFVTGPIAREFGVAHLIATEPEARDGAFTGKVAGVPSFRAGKVTRLEQWLSAMGQALERFDATWFYSDSHNDLPLLELVERPIAVDPDDRLRNLAAARGWPIISLRA
ncbi:MAG TPA: HAD family hydrolase [Burkholderiales bacterium]|jgi:HAD superfamily hydrolase (TIGR01490 family)|nr:HAD family hydrolase [Burkholderiales bacterium]